MSQSLIIVESPSKARTIKKYLGRGYSVKASVGHIRDLPKTKLGVDVEKEFAPKYVTIKGKEKVIKELRKAAESAKEIFLAPDPDREGEAIAFHIVKAIKANDKPVHRVLFNEITKSGITDGLGNPRPIDENLFASQQTRRILDRLVGYKISPILWKKVKRGLSAGRVQSVAMRLVVEKEQEIEAFIPKEYWEIFVNLKAGEPPVLKVKLAKKNNKKFVPNNKDDAGEVVEFLKTNPYKLDDIKIKPVNRNPLPPFITSTMQQTASSQLRMAPKRTMRIAQQLYEGIKLGSEGLTGLITYMRTDSVRVAKEAIDGARDFISNTFGKNFLPEKPNFYRTKKSAQDAHEAIRPASLNNPPDKIKGFLTNEQYRLYRAIWNRFIASQMTKAKFEQTTVFVACGPYTLTATNTVEKFSGFLAAARQINGGKNDEIETTAIPPLEPGMSLAFKDIDPLQKFTQPPARYSESALIKQMESLGIGRPSTYASIISVIQEKEYVDKIGSGGLRPTDLGKAVTRLLIKSFPNIMDVSFTAQMEENLDKIEEGKDDPHKLLSVFWSDFETKLENAAEKMENVKQVGEPTELKCAKCNEPLVIKFGKNGPFLNCVNNHIGNFSRDDNNEIKIVEDEITDEKCEKCDSPMIKKVGKWGPYLACSGYPECKNTISLDKNGNKKSKVKAKPDPNVKCEKCESPMILRTSRYGNRFYSCSSYPKCRGTRPFNTNIPCPNDGKDGGLLVEQLARKGKRRVFWGCTNYPDCDFVTNEQPINSPCEKCGHKVLSKRQKDEMVYCQSCGAEYPDK